MMSDNPFLTLLASRPVLLADGATGTNLQAAGLPHGAAPEDWVFERPDEVLKLQRAFVAAGSDILLTCTFGGTRLRMKDSPYAGQVVELNRRAVGLAREAASDRPGVLVGGSLGPTGQIMAPYGLLSFEDARAAYAEQAAALVEAGVDLLVLETHFALEEAQAAFEGARQVTDLPVVVSFSFDRGLRTMMGVKPDQVAQTFVPLGAAAVGANCGTTLENMLKIVQEYAAAPGAVIWAKPNAGLPRLENDRPIYDVTPAQMAEVARQYFQAGARIIGGCCGSTPEHVAAMREVISFKQ